MNTHIDSTKYTVINTSGHCCAGCKKVIVLTNFLCNICMKKLPENIRNCYLKTNTIYHRVWNSRKFSNEVALKAKKDLERAKGYIRDFYASLNQPK